MGLRPDLCDLDATRFESFHEGDVGRYFRIVAIKVVAEGLSADIN